MSHLITKQLTQRGKSLMLKIHVAPLHSSIESSVQLLFQNRPNDVISRFKEKGDSNMGELHPLEMNVFALGLLFSGNIEESIAIQSQTVKYFTQSLGSTSDSFLDIAGSINDLAVMHTANKDYVAAEKSLKRALLMVERSYKVDTHLRSSLLGNLANVHRLTGNRESCLHYTEELLPLLSKNYTAKKHAAVDISTLNPAESQESLDLFWKNLTQSSSNVAEETKSDNGGIIARDRFYNSRQLFSSIRKVQFFLSAGHSIGTSRLHEEGLIYLNKAFEVIVTNSIDSHGGDDLILKDSFVLSAALATLGELSEHSQKQRGKGLIAKHIEHDNVSKLFKLPYFTTNYPSICDLDLGLTSSSRDLKNAATQLYKSRISKQISHNNFNNELSEYDRMMFCNKGIVGIALLDIEHFCPLISASDPQTPDAESSISN